jgi:hypothetical protein
LPALAGWMLDRLNSERNGLASEVIRNANQIFLGVGVYTVVELLFLAGNVEPYCQVCQIKLIIQVYLLY